MNHGGLREINQKICAVRSHRRGSCPRGECAWQHAVCIGRWSALGKFTGTMFSVRAMAMALDLLGMGSGSNASLRLSTNSLFANPDQSLSTAVCLSTTPMLCLWRKRLRLQCGQRLLRGSFLDRPGNQNAPSVRSSGCLPGLPIFLSDRKSLRAVIYLLDFPAV